MFASDKFELNHVNSAYREFAAEENLKEVAQAAGFHSPQTLRNKLCIEHSHNLTVNELAKIVKVTDNRCIIDGLLLEVDCEPSIAFQHFQSIKPTTFKDSLVKAYIELGILSDLCEQVKESRGLKANARNRVIRQSINLINEFRCLIHHVESNFSNHTAVTGRMSTKLKAAS